MLKTMAMLSKGNKLRIFRISSVSFLEAVLGSVPYGILFLVIRDIMDGSLTSSQFLIYTSVIIVSALFRTYFSYHSVTTSRNDGNVIIKELRLKLGEHIRKLPLGFFNTHDIGELSNKTLDNINKTEMILTMILPTMTSTLVLSLLVSALLFFIDIPMAIATLVTMPLALGILTWARNIMDKQGRALYESSTKLAGSLLEFVNGIKYIKSFNSSDRKYKSLVGNMADFRHKSLMTEGLLSPVMVFAGISIDFGLVVLILTGTYMLAGGELTGQSFLIFIVISSRFFEGLKALSINFVKVKYLGIAGESIRDLFDEKHLAGTGNREKIDKYDISFENVRFSYEDTDVLKGVNLDIAENTLTAFVGPSGSGKTTMTNLIARFFDVSAGEIRIGGKNIRNVDPEAVLENISMVFQDVMLFRDTVFNNIKIGKHGATYEEVIEASKKANAHDFIMSLPNGYDTLVGENGSNLSGGEKQRISIARAILKDSPIILLDEATASLDPENEIYIQRAITELLENKTVIVIAHRLKTIKDANKIVVFESGKIVEEGTHSRLLENREGLYRSMWETQDRSSGWEIAN